MRLILMGQQAFGKAVLERLLETGADEVVSVYCAPDREGRPQDPLKESALAAGIPVRQPAGFKEAATLDAMRSDAADLLIMAYVTLFVPAAARDVPKLGSICFHPSLLPLHRGPSSINWPIIGGAKKTGFSWFYPTDGLDEGDLLLQEECDIGPDDTLGDIYFKKIFPAATASVDRVCDLFRSGNPPRRQQDEARATYESWCRKADVEIDWSQPAPRVYNLIRGSNPQPGAWTRHDGSELIIYDSERVGGSGHPGRVTAVDEQGVTVQAGGGRIRVKRVRPADEGKISAIDWARKTGIGAGAALGGQD